MNYQKKIMYAITVPTDKQNWIDEVSYMKKEKKKKTLGTLWFHILYFIHLGTKL